MCFLLFIERNRRPVDSPAASAHLSTIHYELSHPLRGRILAHLEQLASEHKFNEEASIFRHALNAELEVNGLSLNGLRGATTSPLALSPANGRENELVRGLLRAVRLAPSVWDSRSKVTLGLS